MKAKHFSDSLRKPSLWGDCQCKTYWVLIEISGINLTHYIVYSLILSLIIIINVFITHFDKSYQPKKVMSLDWGQIKYQNNLYTYAIYNNTIHKVYNR